MVFKLPPCRLLASSSASSSSLLSMQSSSMNESALHCCTAYSGASTEVVVLGVLVVVDSVTVGVAVGGRDGSLTKQMRWTVVALLQLLEGGWAISEAFAVAVVVDIAALMRGSLLRMC